jgi:hypothetical protein
MPNLDGQTPVTATPFDAHERLTRGEHVPTKADEATPHAGLGQQYPKAVDHVEGSEPGSKEPILVNSAEQEKAYLDAKSAASSAPPLPAPEPSSVVIETKQYSDGSSATGPAPLPDLSPEQQAAQ